MKRKNLALTAIVALSIALAGCSASDAATTGTESNDTAYVETESIEEETSDDWAENVGTGDTYSATESEEHAVSASGEEASYDNIFVTKTGDSDGDESDFYGTNAAVYAEEGATLNITNSKITTDGAHANAVFSYGEGTTLNISDSVIETTQNNSGGIMVTGGGTLNANNLIVTTQGGSSAAIRSDRGGGVMNVEGGSYSSYGLGSPAIYSTAEVFVNNATLYSDVSQAVVVEGKNSVTLNNVDATGNNTGKNSDNSDTYQAVMIYQSMSGDAAEGQGSFTMNGGSLTSLNGGMFFVTNTVAEVNLSNVALTYATDDLLRIEKAGWGNEGSNGGQVNFNASTQELQGIISVDEISKLNLYLKDNSSFEGSIEGEGEVYVEIEDGSTWKLTGDSCITSLTCGTDAIDLNGYTLTVNGVAYEEGTSSNGEAIEFTVTQGEGGMDGMTPPDGEGQGGPGSDGGQAPDGNGQGGPGGDGSSAPDGNGQGGPGSDGGQAPDGNGQGAPGGDGSEPPAKPN